MAKEIQILVFRLGSQLWGVNILDVNEVVKIKLFTLVPRAPKYILGVFNLRGQIIPLLDISVILNINSYRSYKEAVIVEYDNEMIGIAVEKVIGVYRIEESKIRPAPSEIGDHTSGIVDLDNKMINLIKLERIISMVIEDTGF